LPGIGRGGERELEKKVWELGRWREREEREKRKRNVVVKGLEVGEGGIMKAVGELWERMGVKAEVEKMWEVNKRKEGNKKMTLVKIKDREMKREMMQKKGALRGREERIEDDLTVMERRMMENRRDSKGGKEE